MSLRLRALARACVVHANQRKEFETLSKEAGNLLRKALNDLGAHLMEENDAFDEDCEYWVDFGGEGEQRVIVTQYGEMDGNNELVRSFAVELTGEHREAR